MSGKPAHAVRRRAIGKPRRVRSPQAKPREGRENYFKWDGDAVSGHLQRERKTRPFVWLVYLRLAELPRASFCSFPAASLCLDRDALASEPLHRACRSFFGSGGARRRGSERHARGAGSPRVTCCGVFPTGRQRLVHPSPRRERWGSNMMSTGPSFPFSSVVLPVLVLATYTSAGSVVIPTYGKNTATDRVRRLDAYVCISRLYLGRQLEVVKAEGRPEALQAVVPERRRIKHADSGLVLSCVFPPWGRGRERDPPESSAASTTNVTSLLLAFGEGKLNPRPRICP